MSNIYNSQFILIGNYYMSFLPSSCTNTGLHMIAGSSIQSVKDTQFMILTLTNANFLFNFRFLTRVTSPCIFPISMAVMVTSLRHVLSTRTQLIMVRVPGSVHRDTLSCLRGKMSGP